MNKAIKYGIVGFKGRMGKEIINAMNEEGHELVFGYDLNERFEQDKPEVIFDFSLPSALEATLSFALKYNSKLAIGTTGYTADEKNKIISVSDTIAVLYSTNFSVGVYALKEILKVAKKIMSDWDCEVVELHHKKKKDKPSGTAKSLLEILGEDKLSHSLRIGGVVGEHSVYFANSGDLIEIRHSAISRRTFAEGARLAAKFLLDKQRGYYTFEDIFKEK
jgi:4-hydroxy-tetrahydrodipicolinate reductase